MALIVAGICTGPTQSPIIPTATGTTSKVSGPFNVALLTVFSVLNLVDRWLDALALCVKFML